MPINYLEIREQVLAHRPAYEALLARITDLAIPGDLPLREFFTALREINLQGARFGRLLEADPEFKAIGLEELKAMNAEFYAPVEPKSGYATCIANPDHAVELFGEGLGQLLSCIYLKHRQARQFHIDSNYLALEQNLELFFSLFALAESGNIDLEAWKAEYRRTTLDNIELKSTWERLKQLSPESSYYREVIQNADLSDLRYLYRYGVYVSEHELAMAEFLAAYPERELENLAKFIVQSWVDGFVRAKKDHRTKRYANLIFPSGMERLGRLLILGLERIGITPLVARPHSQGINKQYSYDHRFDMALVLDREFVDLSLKLSEKILEDLKELIGTQAGPVYVELFGETPFTPEAKASAIQLSPGQQQLWRELTATSANLYFKHYRREETSFTIIAFPSPEIGANFREIFADTLKINLLHSGKYALIQQKIIDVLDTAEFVHVKGKPGNDTDILVKMHTITDPANQTNFENCVADVNIPVGEVFTSPVLTGTTGTLHVEDIYLGNLRYYNLRIRFEDGWVKDYSCSNFENPEEGKKYIHENLLLPHATLPIGEFAIGTNTLAYQIARKYDIQALLPILIIEKMGPHFAIGDTCFSHEEEAPHPSFVNGKEMIAVDNEKSATRKEDPIGAYTQKHMDITLPYDMLASITALTHDGKQHLIIENGRFVVPGTEELNIPLDEMDS
ncbi:MAG: aminopeptidase [Candidatus Cloacimonetes bacterium]|nr:aminopeptidase [Candidatus Cloacimonadota bacterium]